MPTRGMERWLTQRLSARLGARPGRADGICANVEFPFPRALVGEAVAAAAGVDPGADPWLPERAVWPLLEVVGDCLEEPWLARLAAHLGEPGDAARRARRFATVRHLAGLFDRYGLERPDMVLAWAAGRDVAGAVGRGGRRGVGVAGAPGDGAVWQAELWRRLRARIGTPSPAERLAGACARLEADPAVVALPARVSLFGLTRLPAGHLRVLAALAAGRDVHVWILHPSPRLWERIAALTATRAPVVRRAEDPTTTLPTGRLLASWGHDVRELQLVLAAAGPAGHHHPVGHGGATLLARIQAAVREDRAPPAAPLGPGDRSIEVHACHGRARQVEVVRDAILQALAEDPTLEPRDVIVMCPDVEAFAPLIHATFGAGEVTADEDELETVPPELRPPDLRVRLADRSLRQTNPILGVVATLIELAGQRLTASQVLDLAAREPVRRRFRLDDDDLGRVEDWVRASGIRWGLDGEQRAPFRLGGIAAGTWRTGLDRVLLGVTMTEDEHRLFGGVLPLDDVDSGAIDLAGRFAELVDRLDAALAALRSPQPVAALGHRARRRRRRAHRHDPARRLAALGAAAAARRRRRRGGRGGRADSRARRGPRPARRAPPGAPDARELPHGAPHDLHARPDALGAPPGRLPARPGRRRLPAPLAARRGRSRPRRPARRRPRPARRGPPAAARRADGRDGAPRRDLHGQRRAHERRPPARGAGGRAARRGRARRPGRGRRHPPSPAALRPAQLHPRRARARAPVELRSGRARGRPRARGRARRAGPVPRRAVAGRHAGARRARGPRALHGAPGARVPAPAARRGRRRLRGRDRGRAARRARAARAVAGGRPDPRGADGGRLHAHRLPGRARPRRAAARPARQAGGAGHRQPRRRGRARRAGAARRRPAGVGRRQGRPAGRPRA